ncbi:MAG: alcohol dehydrogenase catalytic domain-containing protein, partial [Lachnospiraceae bacterium]|nr:alcohol dehydrogenase catalytic domain-containing protein [Lachnospiraceae bacterium]
MYLQREAQRVTLAGICTSDLQVKHGSVPRAALGVTVGHEMYGKNLTFKTGGVGGCK